jgi:truncated hemoglobin YjbI
MAMAEERQEQLAAFLDIWIGGVPDRTKYFDQDNVRKLANDHGIREERTMLALLLLELAALAYWKEAERAARDYSKHRKELDQLEKAAAKLASVLDELDPETLRIVHEARVARGFKDFAIEGVVDASVQAVFKPQAATGSRQSERPNKTRQHNALRAALVTVINDAQAGKRWAGEGKSGRPRDDSAADLMQMCFLIWTNLVGREFTMAWYENQPDSDAARFCVDVAAIVDPKLSASRIDSATRKVRETGFNISDLEKLTAEAEEFRKRLD